MSGSDWEALPDVWEWSGGPPRCPGDVGRTSRMSVFRMPSRMSGSARKDLPDAREWSVDPAGCAGVVGRPSRLHESGRQTLPDVQ